MYWETSIINSNFTAIYLGANSNSFMIFPCSPISSNLAIAGKWNVVTGSFDWFKFFNDGST